MKSGMLKADGKGKVYAEIANKKPLSKVEARQKYGLQEGRGRDFVEFKLKHGQKWKIDYNNRIMGNEVIIQGDVPLGPGSRILQRWQ